MPRNTISRCAHTTAPLSVSLLHTLVPYFFSFSISSIALSLFTPNSRPFSDNVVSLVSSLFTNILVFIVFSRFSFYYINFFDHYFQPYSSLSSISRIQLFSFSLLLHFSFISTIWLDEDDEAHVSYTVSQPEADEKPNLPSHLTLLNFFRARVFSGTTRGACAFIARELREGLHLYETQMSNTTSASKQIKRECIYIFWNRGSSNFDRVVY